MAFCVNCGTKIEEGSKFCTKCGTPLTGSVINAGSAPVEQIAQNPNQPTAVHAGGAVKKSKLLITAIIVAPVLFIISIVTTVIITNREVKEKKERFSSIGREWWMDNPNLTDEQKNMVMEKEAEAKKQAMIAKILVPIGWLLILAIPTLLIINGEKKKKRKMILAAGIIYVVTYIGIPSAVLCFIAFAKMKKQI
jgi:flagellar basal body-associated protein FliL